MTRISANVGFLWGDLPLPERIVKAAQAGFAAVETHFPYEHDPHDIAALLDEVGIPMLGINTANGGQEGDFGVASIAGRQSEARELIDQAIEYAAVIGARHVNVVAGRTISDDVDRAEAVYRENLHYAATSAAAHDITIVIEPLSTTAMPGYHFNSVDWAAGTIAAVDAANLKLMFDCFHTQIMQGDLVNRLRSCLAILGHVQISAVHDRGEPDQGEINYQYVLGELDAMGYDGWVGAEYRPRTTVEAGIGWLDAYKN